MLLQLVIGAPLWVWPLLFFLVGYGLRASRDRETSAIPVYLIPLLGLLTLSTVVAMPGGAPVWLGYGLAYGVAVLAGHALQARWIVAKVGSRVRLRGEWLTMAVVMLLFWLNYAWSAVSVVSPGAAAGLGVQLGFAIIVGLASGSLLGRTLRVAFMPRTAHGAAVPA